MGILNAALIRTWLDCGSTVSSKVLALAEIDLLYKLRL